jgi:DNA-binding PadR family transcriptional regulator
MVKTLESDDQVRLSQLDVKLLCALLQNKANAYELVKQLSGENQDDPKLSYGSVSRGLRRLEQFHMVTGVEHHAAGRLSITYNISDLGREYLVYELKRLKNLISRIETSL